MQLANLDVTVDPTQKSPWYADLAQQAMALIQAERLRKENKDRINRGLPPLSQREAAALAPTANVNVALPQGVQTALILGGIGLVGLLLINMNKRGRRR